MDSSAPGIQAADIRREDFVPAPIPAERVLAGDPVARSCDLSGSKDGGLSMNLWDCTAGRFRWTFGADELIQVIEGEVHVTDAAGETTVLTAGSTAHFAAGTEMVWEIPHYLKKLAIHRRPVPVPARVILSHARQRVRRAQVRPARLAAGLAPVVSTAGPIMVGGLAVV